MAESRNVYSDNPAVFMIDLQQAIQDGFRVSNTNAGYPLLNSILKEVRVFREDAGSVVPVADDVTSQFVAEWDGMRYLLAFQNLVLQGFEVDPSSVKFDGMKTAKLVRVDGEADKEAEVQALTDNLSEIAEMKATKDAALDTSDNNAPEKPDAVSPQEAEAQKGTKDPVTQNDAPENTEEFDSGEAPSAAQVKEEIAEEAPKKSRRSRKAK